MDSIADLVGKEVNFMSENWKLLEFLHVHMQIPLEVRNRSGLFVVREGEMNFRSLLPGNTYRIPPDFNKD